MEREKTMARDGYSKFSMDAVIVAILAGLMVISGCATLGKDECLNADWRSIGYEDGARGYSGSHIGNHRKACAKYGVVPNLDQYEEGRLKGLREYCTPRNGYRLGIRGKRYNGVCPTDLDPAFRYAMQDGRKIYVLEKEVQQKKHELKKAYKDLDALEMKLSDKEAELIKPGVRPRRRKYLLDEFRMLEDEQKALFAEIVEMEKVLELMKLNLYQVRDQSPYK
jgi:hypothetical protein